MVWGAGKDRRGGTRRTCCGLGASCQAGAFVLSGVVYLRSSSTVLGVLSRHHFASGWPQILPPRCRGISRAPALVSHSCARCLDTCGNVAFVKAGETAGQQGVSRLKRGNGEHAWYQNLKPK